MNWVASIPGYARFVRGEALSVRESEYVEVMRGLGTEQTWITFGTVLPNILSPLVIYASYSMSLAVLSTAALSFLSLGPQPPMPEWSAMLVQSRTFLCIAYWVVAAPRFAIFFSILGLNHLGNGIRDVLDPQGLPMSALLGVRDFTTEFVTGTGVKRPVDWISFSLEAGEVMGLVGESGSGKTVTALSLLRLIARPGRIANGEIRFKGQNLLELSERETVALRGNQISMIFQQPRACLNPVLTIGAQMAELFQWHKGAGRRDALRKSVALLARVGIPALDRKTAAYPLELSGGQAQRVMISMALALNPRLLMADEPTTALDMTIQSQILSLLGELFWETGISIILVTHDLGVVAEMVDRVAVMYLGRIVELADTETLAGPTVDTSDIDDVHFLESIEQIEVLSDPLRYRMTLLMETQATCADLARQLGLSRAGALAFEAP